MADEYEDAEVSKLRTYARIGARDERTRRLVADGAYNEVELLGFAPPLAKVRRQGTAGWREGLNEEEMASVIQGSALFANREKPAWRLGAHLYDRPRDFVEEEAQIQYEKRVRPNTAIPFFGFGEPDRKTKKKKKST